MALTNQWESAEALQKTASSIASTANELCQVTGPVATMCTLRRVLFDMQLTVTVADSGAPPERWWAATYFYLVIHHDPGSPGSHPTPFSDDPRILARVLLRPTLTLSPSSPTSYYVNYVPDDQLDFHGQRKGSGNPFAPPRVTATLWPFDGYGDLNGTFPYTINISWFGALHCLFLHS